jgi:serine/threonine protein kinase
VRVASGTRFGPYEILALLGSGGMGDVYRARDTRLLRDVAIKILNPAIARDADLRRRFDREARAIATLNHPHIAALYDIGEEREIQYLVMEYVAGDTLTAHLRSGPLAIDESLRFGIEIADALAAAHREGMPEMIGIAADPTFDGIRRTGGYQDRLREIGLNPH